MESRDCIMGKQRIAEIRANAHNLSLDLRTLDYALQSCALDKVFETLPQKEQEEIVSIIDALINVKVLQRFRAWTVQNRKAFNSELTTIDLKELAKKQGIKGWSRLTKSELIQIVGRCYDEKEEIRIA